MVFYFPTLNLDSRTSWEEIFEQDVIPASFLDDSTRIILLYHHSCVLMEVLITC